MNENTPLDERMKRYEHAFRQYLPRRTYTLIRLDGRAFHTYLRGAERPFDNAFIRDMDTVALALCMEIQGAEFAYVQSDEISLLLTDFATPQTQPWFDGNLNKVLSISAACASAMLTTLRIEKPGMPQFDSRAWTMSDPVEVANYFVWRQRDAVRNSVQMVGQAHFSQSQLHGKSCADIQEMLFSVKGINWNDFTDRKKRGGIVHRVGMEWQIAGAPHFVAEPDSALAMLIPPLPTLS
jgi:tRNA(His) guanylyltransferase